MSFSLVAGHEFARWTRADAAAERVAIEADRARFETRPDLEAFQRAPFPGELRALIPPGFDLAAVGVYRVGTGKRLRVPVFRPLQPHEIN